MALCFRYDYIFRSMDDKPNVEEMTNDNRNSYCIDSILYCLA